MLLLQNYLSLEIIMTKVYFAYLLLLIGYATALTDYEIALTFAKKIVVCAKDYTMDISDFKKLQQLEVPTKTDTKCLLACVYKNFKTMKSDGMFDLDASHKLAEEAKKGDEKGIENGKKLADICIKVNDEKVSDGEKGCDRAALMFGCVVENAPKLGFNIRFDFDKVSLT